MCSLQALCESAHPQRRWPLRNLLALTEVVVGGAIIVLWLLTVTSHVEVLAPLIVLVIAFVVVSVTLVGRWNTRVADEDGVSVGFIDMGVSGGGY